MILLRDIDGVLFQLFALIYVAPADSKGIRCPVKRRSCPNLGCCFSKCFRSGGMALAIACRTILRCTPYFFACPLIVSPAAWPPPDLFE